MTVEDYFEMQPGAEQVTAFKNFCQFIEDDEARIFILKGNAGTGKTFMIKAFLSFLKEKEIESIAIAPTGRAAKVIENNTGKTAQTIHSYLYSVNEVKSADKNQPNENQHNFQVLFSPREMSDEVNNIIHFIDEASMIGIRKFKGLLGDLCLLDNLVEFTNNAKLVFIGDHCQLAPVFEETSYALDETYIKDNYDSNAYVSYLTEIYRQDDSKGFMDCLSMLRTGIVRDQFMDWPVRLNLRNKKAVSILKGGPLELFNKYVSRFKASEPIDLIALANSNNDVHVFNSSVRQALYGDVRAPLQEGEVLMVQQNNYLSDLSNGDFIKVLKIGEDKRISSLTFKKVIVKSLFDSNSNEHELWLSMDIMHSEKYNNFTSSEMEDLMKGFSMYCRDRGIKSGSEEWRAEIRNNPFLNCLKAKYGYATTIYKSQGGEWPHVYLHITRKMTGIPASQLYRLYYTAISRCKEHLHVVDDYWIQGAQFRRKW